MSRPTQAIIDLAALRHNYALACELSGEGKAMPIIKANAYGHGAEQIAKTLEPLAPAFGVACIEEALALRKAGIEKPILLLEGAFASDEIPIAAEQGFWLTAASAEQVAAITRQSTTQPVNVWLKLDTGMHRLGIPPEQTTALYGELHQSPLVSNVTLSSHFACADDLNSELTPRQIDCFNTATAGLKAHHSLANSAALLGWPKARAEWNRPGFMLYGGSPFDTPHPQADKLKAVMTLKSAIIGLREIDAGERVGYTAAWKADRPSRIATVAIGYGDGYPRTAANGTPVLVNGQRVSLTGRVSMDMISVDVTDLPNAALGDEVTLWGDGLPMNEVAQHAGTIGYELITRMPLRTPRAYIN